MEGEENKKRNIMKTKWNESDKKRLIELYQLGCAMPEIGDKMDRSILEVQSEFHLLRREGRVSYRTSESEAWAYQNDCPDSIRDIMTAKTARTNSVFNEILENIKYTHDKKNDDYKDSYSDTMKRFGTKSGLVRIYDKFNRIENILDSEGKANFESAEDNLQDLATYAIMMLAYIKKGGEK